MDAKEDSQVINTDDLLDDLSASIPLLLRDADNEIRPWIHIRKVERVISLFEPFQEYPQLLDQRLAVYSSIPVATFIEFLLLPYHQRPLGSTDLIPLPRAVCKILYTLCKIRGPRIISSFFNVEPRYLQPMVSAFLSWNQAVPQDGPRKDQTTLEWNERYIMLLWISHLLLAPFDLSSLSAPTDLESEPLPFDIKENGLPQVAKQILQICHEYLSVGSKERESAGTLLVRLILRPDMRKLRLLESIASNIVSEFSSRAVTKPLYVYIGYLSFLSRLFSTADAEAVAPMISSIASSILQMATGIGAIDLKVQNSALARKIIIKILRGCAMLLLERSSSISRYVTDEMNMNINNEIVDHLITMLGDQDTPVRYAASKALAILALKLEPEMSFELINVITESLEEDIRRIQSQVDGTQTSNGTRRHVLGSTIKDFAAVDQFRWHGTTLTLSQLLFRRSPPPELLPRILDCLFVALTFEQKSSTGGSLGTSVRDVACFGIWSISRKYKTEELLAIGEGLTKALSHKKGLSAIQILAEELTVTATLDPAGNIRRGSSAALQELVGRHPDTASQGISLIQVVDYHAVSRRTIAMTDVAIGAAKLDEGYALYILNGLSGWRGLQSADLDSRRAASKSVGILSSLSYSDNQRSPIRIIYDLKVELVHLKERNVDERHGYMLAVASVIEANSKNLDLMEVCQSIVLPILNSITPRMLTAFEVRPEVTSEACCVLVASIANAIHSNEHSFQSFDQLIRRSLELLDICILQNSAEAVRASSRAAYELSVMLDSSTRSKMITKWSLSTSYNSRGAIREPMIGIINAIGATFTSLSNQHYQADDNERRQNQESILDALISVTRSPQVEARVAGLHALAHVLKSSSIISDETVECIRYSLNDYTVDERGDIGSHVRIAALEASDVAFKKRLLPLISAPARKAISTPIPPLYPEILRLAGEKLDKVRNIASQSLTPILPHSIKTVALSSNVSSIAYFNALLILPISLHQPGLQLPILTGLLTSTASGSQTVATACRAALLSHISSLSETDTKSTLACFLTILRTSQTDERLALPTLTTLSFLLDAGAIGTLTDFPWRSLYVATAKAHLKSKSSAKVEAAVGVYAGLYRSMPVALVATRKEVLAKLGSMLAHPFSQVRQSVVESLWELAVEREADKNILDVLEKEDWTENVKVLKEATLRIQKNMESWA